MLLLFLILWVLVGGLFAVAEQLYAQPEQWTGDFRYGEIIRRSKYGFFIGLDLVAYFLDKKELAQTKSDKEFWRDVEKELDKEEDRGNFDEFFDGSQTQASDVSGTREPYSSSGSDLFDYDSLVAQAKEKNEEAEKKREEAQRLRIAKECVEKDKYEPNFIDEDNLVELNLHGDISEGVIARANFILEEESDKEKFMREVGDALDEHLDQLSKLPKNDL